MAEQREDDELKELTFTVKVKVQVRADLPEEGLRVELQRDVRKFLEELASSYTHDAVDHRDHRVSRDICRRCRAVRLLKALEELQQK